ncbi:uncharacterized protein B0P05DRAFT_457205, partial [Gilbertella persicaria]|uniref:uncharacterized protein n=1 Tax=Gilbertella persicaria TaxID=101096 RepID=UPI00221E9403
EMIASIRLGSDVSCMIHFKYPPYLNHLICTGSYQDDELSVYDWRFGIKVGSLPWKTSKEDDEAVMDVRPWGLESTLVLPPCWPSQDAPLAHHGFRLIAVGDNRSDTSRDKLEIKVWDISYLLQVAWDPFDARPIDGLTDTLQLELAHRFSWWPRRTQELTRLAL